jgi:iron complex outermembrane receptor protein
MRGWCCRCLAFSALIMTAVLTAPAAFAQTTYKFNLPEQSLADSLRAIGQQTEMNILFEPDAVKSVRSPALHGSYTADDAIRWVLKGTKLEAQHTTATNVVVKMKPATSTASPVITSPASGEANRLAQFSGSSESQPNTNGPQNTNTSSSQSESEKEKLSEIVVTGTHIRGEEPIGSHLIVLDRDYIDRSGYGRVEDVLATLPQNFAGNNDALGGATQQSFQAQNFNRGAEIQLRGLGVGTTLTLVNGHRLPSGGLVGDFVDISTIPTSAIERIEVLPDGASAIYGSDAIGGVVNFILRKDFSGAETRARFSSAQGDAKERQLSQLFGTTWTDGSALVGYQYYLRDPLPASDRSRSSLNNDFTSLGGSDFRSNDVGAVPGTILDPNFNPAYAIPRGQDGTHLTLSQLIQGANYTDFVSHTNVLPRQEMNSAFFNLSQRFGSTWEIFADGRFSSRQFKYLIGPNEEYLSVPSTNPFYVNPFESTSPGVVNVAYDFSKEFGPQSQKGTDQNFDSTVGAIVHLAQDWQITIDGSYAKEINSYLNYNRTNYSLAEAALSDPNPATSLNVFGDGTANNPKTLAGLEYSEYHQGVSELWSSSVIADGPLFAAPGGNARLAIGTDYRNESLHAVSPADSLDTRSSRNVIAGFAELSVPLVGPSSVREGPKRLELSLAGREERYSDFGHTFNPKVGLTWFPWNDLKVRGTWGTSFRAPSFAQTDQAIGPLQYGSSVVVDPKSPTGQSNILYLAGNNPDLKQETATVWTGGLDFKPEFVPHVNLALTYFDIHYKDKIGALGDINTVLQFENYYSSIITRNPSSAQVSAICTSPVFFGNCAQPIAAIVDARDVNISVLDVRGLDFDLSDFVDTGFGRWSGGVGGTYTFTNKQAVTANSPALSTLDTVGYPLALRMRGRLAWNLRGWSASAVANYAGAYRNPGATPDRVSSLTTVDLNFGYETPSNSGWLDKTQIFLSAINVLNKTPPFVNQVTGYDGANANLLGRMLSVQVVKGW